MADWGAIGNMLQGVGAGFSGTLPQYLQSKAIQEESDILKDKDRRQALLRDFYTGAQMIKAGRVDQATQLFGNRLEMLKKLNAPNIADTQAIYDRLVSGDPAKIQEVSDNLGAFIKTGMAMGEFEGMTGKGPEGAKSTKVYNSGDILQAASDKTLTLTTTDGQVLTPQSPEWSAAIARASQSGIQYAGDEAAAKAAGAGNVNIQLDPIIASLVKRAEAGVELETKPEIEGQTQKTKLLVERAGARLDAGLQAASSLPGLYRMSELLKTVDTGGFSRVTAAAQDIFGVLPKDTAELKNLMGRQVLSQLKASFGGNPSEREGEFLQKIEAELNKGSGANQAIINNAITLLEARAKNGKKAAKYLEDDDSAAEIDSYINLKLGQQSGDSDEDAQAIAWARSNPNDPRAAAILQQAGQK